MKTWAQTYVGDKFDYVNTTEEMIHAQDIARALGSRGRYLGMTKEHYSVAEHCIILADHAMKETDDVEVALWALLHDAPEAYLPDLPRPFRSMPEVKEVFDPIHDRFMQLIARKFELKGEMPEWVPTHDALILHDEAQQVFPTRPIDDWDEWYAPGIGARIQFLHRGHAAVVYSKKLTDLLALRLEQEPRHTAHRLDGYFKEINWSMDLVEEGSPEFDDAHFDLWPDGLILVNGKASAVFAGGQTWELAYQHVRERLTAFDIYLGEQQLDMGFHHCRWFDERQMKPEGMCYVRFTRLS